MLRASSRIARGAGCAGPFGRAPAGWDGVRAGVPVCGRRRPAAPVPVSAGADAYARPVTDIIEFDHGIRLSHGDCRDMLAGLPEGCADACVTDPPYEINFMNRAFDRTGIAFDPEFWRLVYRALKPGGHVLAFSASRTYHRMACAVEDAGFEIRDQIDWI